MALHGSASAGDAKARKRTARAVRLRSLIWASSIPPAIWPRLAIKPATVLGRSTEMKDMEDIGLKLVIVSGIGLLGFIASDIHAIRKMMEWRNRELAKKLYPLE
jgi:hypothetical protein